MNDEVILTNHVFCLMILQTIHFIHMNKNKHVHICSRRVSLTPPPSTKVYRYIIILSPPPPYQHLPAWTWVSEPKVYHYPHPLPLPLLTCTNMDISIWPLVHHHPTPSPFQHLPAWTWVSDPWSIITLPPLPPTTYQHGHEYLTPGLSGDPLVGRQGWDLTSCRGVYVFMEHGRL